MSLHAPAVRTTQASTGWVLADGTEEWRLPRTEALGCVLHREDGPAVTRPNGTKEWWIHGKRVFIMYTTGQVHVHHQNVLLLHMLGHTVPAF